MKKLIEVEFKDDFVPPEKFDLFQCFGCPFYNSSDMDDWCAIEDRSDKCPIKRFFEEENNG